MIIGDSNLEVWLIVLMLVMVLSQTIGLVIAITILNRRLQKLHTVLEQVSATVLKQTGTARDLLTRLGWIRENLPVLEERVESEIDRVSSSLKHFNTTSAEKLASARQGVRASSRKTEYTLTQFTRQTSRVHHWVRIPTIYTSATLLGVATGIKHFLRNGRSHQPATHLPDEETFI